MTGRLQCRFCPRPLTNPESQQRGFGETCGRRRGLIPPKARRTRVVPRLKPATLPNPPDVPPGQTALELYYFEATLDSI